MLKKLPAVRKGKISIIKRYKKGIIIKSFLIRVLEKYFIHKKLKIVLKNKISKITNPINPKFERISK